LKYGIYAGSFDPVTNGHLDIIKRSLSFCDKLTILVGIHPNKKTMFNQEDRIALVAGVLEDEGLSDKVDVGGASDLTVRVAEQLNASFMVRGIRSVSDFEYEINLANINKVLCPTVETVFIPTQPEMAVVSSSAAKELVKYGQDISKFVPPRVDTALRERLEMLARGWTAQAEQPLKSGFIKYGETK